LHWQQDLSVRITSAEHLRLRMLLSGEVPDKAGDTGHGSGCIDGGFRRVCPSTAASLKTGYGSIPPVLPDDPLAATPDRVYDGQDQPDDEQDPRDVRRQSSDSAET
jgi:hypothetical protein